MASYQKPRFNRSLLAAIDLSASQFLYVSDNGSELANIAGGINGAVGLGFLMNKPEAGEECEIATIGGGAKGVAVETISAALTELKADAAGKMAVALPGDKVSAIALQTAAASDVFELMPVQYFKSAGGISILAAVDLTSSQGLYVGDNGSGKLNVVGGINGAVGYGFLANAPDADESAIVQGLGNKTALGIAGATITGAKIGLKSNALGKLETALPGDIVVAISTASASLDDSMSVIPTLYQKNSVPIVFDAAADLTLKQYFYVGDSSGDVDVAGGLRGAAGYGFLMNVPDITEEAVINGPGMPFAKGISGAAFAIAAELKSNALGKLETALVGDIVVAVALELASAADETIDVVPVLYVKPADHITFAAAEDLRTGQYLYVGENTGLKKVGGATGAIGYGFLQNAPNTAEDAIINGPGFPTSKAKSGAATTLMTELMSDATGRLIDTTAAGDIVCALGLESTSGAGETFTVIPVLYRKHA